MSHLSVSAPKGEFLFPLTPGEQPIVACIVAFGRCFAFVVTVAVATAVVVALMF